MHSEIFETDLELLHVEAAGRSIWYVGTQLTVDEGIVNLFAHLDEHGHILVDKPQIVDYFYHGRSILYVIFYKSLTKLEYLENEWLKRDGI